MKNQIALLPPATDTETLLQALILEAHAIIREDVRPAIAECEELHDRRQLMHCAVQLVEIGATVGDAIARLRFGSATEMRQRITVERLSTTPQPDGGR